MKYFLIYLFVETIVSTEFASMLGGLMTFVEIVLSALVGIIILQNFNYSIAQNLMRVYNKEISSDDFAKMHISSLIGAVLLIIPGFFTDIVGIILQFESLALPLVRKVIKPKESSVNEKFYKEEIIDVEIIEDNKH